MPEFPPMPPEDARPGPLTRHGALLTASMKIHRKDGKILLSQKTRLWFRAAVWLWAMVVLMTPFMIYYALLTCQTTHFTCDRDSGACAVDGRTKDVPRLADIIRAQMDHDFNRRDGANWGINLITRDGKRHAIEQQRAIKRSVVADYRAAVKAINDYLGDPARQKLDASFTYRAGAGEVIQSIFYLIFGVVMLAVGWRISTRRVYIFEPGKITFMTRHPFQRQTQEIAADRIAAISERQSVNRRFIELKLDSASKIPIVEAWREEALATGQLARELAGLLGRRVESASCDSLPAQPSGNASFQN